MNVRSSLKREEKEVSRINAEDMECARSRSDGLWYQVFAALGTCVSVCARERERDENGGCEVADGQTDG